VERRALLERRLEHLLLRGRQRAVPDGPGAAVRHGAGHPHARRGHLPHHLLPAGRHLDGGGVGGVGVALPPEHRPLQRDHQAVRRHPHRLALRPAVGDAGHHPADHLEGHRLLHGHLPGRPARHPERVLRGGQDRRRLRLVDVPPHHLAAAGAHHLPDPRAADDQLVPGLLVRLRHDRRRAAPLHRGRRVLPVPARLREPGVRLRLRHLGGDVRVPGDRHDPPARVRGQPRELRPMSAPAGSLGSRQRRNVFFLTLVLSLVAFLWLFPFVFSFLASFKTGNELLSSIWGLPESFDTANYESAFRGMKYARSFGNSMFVSVSVALLQCATGTLAAFAFARMRFPGKELVFMLFLATLMIPGTVTLTANFLILSKLDWIDTYWALIVPHGASGFAIFLLRQFFMTVFIELEEAARLDGAGRLRFLWSILLPLARPAKIGRAHV